MILALVTPTRGVLVAALLTAGCVGVVGDGGGDGTGGGAPGSAAADAGPKVSPTAVPPVPLARLTSLQYANTIRDLFAPIAVPGQSPPGDAIVDGFDNNTAAQTPSSALIEAYRTSAAAVATAAMQSSAQLLGCTPASRADEDACAHSFISSFGKKAFRRPLAADESANLTGFYASVRASGADFPTAMTATIEAFLQSPAFLYRFEIGTPVPGQAGLVQLTGYEVSSRISYLIWNTMPDQSLLDAAAGGRLATAEGVEAEARRLLADPRAHDAVLNFHREWLRFSKMKNLTKDATMFPGWSSDVATSLQKAADKYVDGVFFGDGTLTALLTDAHAWVDASTASIYGVPSPGPDLVRVSVDPTQRSGILTNAGLLAGFAHETADAPVLRGVFVLDRLLCAAPPPPPANVNTTVPAPNTADPQTTRDRFAKQHEQGTCAGCHHTIDGVGFGFEHYDAIGQWRTTDMGLPVDASGWLPPGGDLPATFSGAVELGKILAASHTVQSCVASQWMRYALGVDKTGIDPTHLKPVVDAFVASGLDLRELVVALVKSDAFRTRVVAP
jgi:hypothetical protein